VSSPILRPSAAAIRIKEASGRAIVQNKAAPAASTSSVGYLLDLCGLDLTKARKISSVGNGVCILSTGLLAGFFGFNLPLPPSKRKKRAKLQLRARKDHFSQPGACRLHRRIPKTAPLRPHPAANPEQQPRCCSRDLVQPSPGPILLRIPRTGSCLRLRIGCECTGGERRTRQKSGSCPLLNGELISIPGRDPSFPGNHC
jgi:hypothetical protein